MPVMVQRCQDGPPAVPSEETSCDDCGAACWLSKRSGAAALALAAVADGTATPLVWCEHCWNKRLAGAVGAN